MLFLQLLSLLVAPAQILGHKAYPDRIAGADGTGTSKCPSSGELPGRLHQISSSTVRLDENLHDKQYALKLGRRVSNATPPPLEIEPLIVSGAIANRADLVFFSDGCMFILLVEHPQTYCSCQIYQRSVANLSMMLCVLPKISPQIRHFTPSSHC